MMKLSILALFSIMASGALLSLKGFSGLVW